MYGYAGLYADINLTNKKVTKFQLEDEMLRCYLGGTGIGARLLYDRVKPSVRWDDPENCVIIATGPLNGTRLAGSGTFSVVSKGALTKGATSTQANGFLGAYLKLAGFDGIVLHGVSNHWVYLFVSDEAIELRDASSLVGLDTLACEQKIKEDLRLPGRQSSVYAVGPAGENRVKFAAFVGDGGHVAAHNGIGAVLGSKRVKAIAVKRERGKVPLYNEEKVAELAKLIINRAREHPVYKQMYYYGTSYLLENYAKTGLLPVKNLTTNVICNEYLKLAGSYYRKHFELKPTPCWACPSRHCNQVKVTEGPYKGFVGEEPEYELFAGWGTMIGQSDPGAVIVLNDLCDRLGMDGNEASWLTAFVMECCEKGILSDSDLDGFKLGWGDVEGVRVLLRKIALREGLGDLLAEGLVSASRIIGGRATELGVYVEKGHAPRGHDHRARWLEMVDTATSNTGTIESIGLAVSDPFSPSDISEALVKGKVRNFVDSLVVCMFPTMTMLHDDVSHLVEILNAVTGWDYTSDEAFKMSLRVVNLLRAFNIRHGIGPELEKPSQRYGSTPMDGPMVGRSVLGIWDETLERYYQKMGWDRQTGKPMPETLRSLGLESVIRDL